jgi:hypothetical protein
MMIRLFESMDGRVGKLIQLAIIICAAIYFSPVIWIIFTR